LRDLLERDFIAFKSDMKANEKQDIIVLQNELRKTESALLKLRTADKEAVGDMKLEIERLEKRILAGAVGAFVSICTLSFGYIRTFGSSGASVAELLPGLS
jgi:hypothetical protein